MWEHKYNTMVVITFCGCVLELVQFTCVLKTNCVSMFLDVADFCGVQMYNGCVTWRW